MESVPSQANFELPVIEAADHIGNDSDQLTDRSYQRWLGSLVVRASECDSMVVSLIPGSRTISQLVLGWVTVCGQAYHLGM